MRKLAPAAAEVDRVTALTSGLSIFAIVAAVLGGSQSLHTDSFDEALALPSEKAARIALPPHS